MRRISAQSVSISHCQSSFVVPASGIQDLASFSRAPVSGIVHDAVRHDEHVPVYSANIVLLGDVGVGKSSIAQVFCKSKIISEDSAYQPTTAKTVYNTSMMFDNNIVHCKIIDIPTIRSIPQSRLEEWDQYRHWCLLSADMYILVYDVTRQSSFNFIKVLRENILSVRSSGDCQFIVAGNKIDKLGSNQDAVSKQNKNIQENINLVRKRTHTMIINEITRKCKRCK